MSSSFTPGDSHKADSTETDTSRINSGRQTTLAGTVPSHIRDVDHLELNNKQCDQPARPERSEAHCVECGARVTVDPRNTHEYGHYARCSHWIGRGSDPRSILPDPDEAPGTRAEDER
jgi:hypothetical protein